MCDSVTYSTVQTHVASGLALESGPGYVHIGKGCDVTVSHMIQFCQCGIRGSGNSVISGTQYHSTGSWDLEGHWLQLVHCACLLAMSRYFGYTEVQVPGSWDYGFQK